MSIKRSLCPEGLRREFCSASLGVTDYPQVDNLGMRYTSVKFKLGVRYKPVNFGTETSPNWPKR